MALNLPNEEVGSSKQDLNAIWVMIFLIGGGILRYDRYEEKITFGLPNDEYGFMGRISGFSIAIWRLIATLITIGLLWIMQYVLKYLFVFLLSPFG